MTALLRAEAIKLRSLRSTWVLLLLVVVLAAGMVSMIGTLAGTRGNPSLGPDNLRDMLAVPAAVTAGIVLVLSVLATAGEYRNGTITGSLLVTPRRERFIAGKFAAAALLGAAFAAAAAVASYAATVAVVVAKDLPVRLATGDAALTVLGMTATAALFGVAGAGLGALLRSQTLAVAAPLVWWFVIEGVIPDLLGEPVVARYLPNAAANALIHAGSPAADGAVGPWSGALLLAGYAAAIALGGTALLRRRDVS